MARITLKKDGPIWVEGVEEIINSDGNAISPDRPGMALCRCGASKKKPFCDGSHAKVGFTVEMAEVNQRDRVFKYEGQDITVFYNRLLCSHAAKCGIRLHSVFNSSDRPWIKPDNGTPEDIKAVVAACPSGALRYAAPGGEPTHIESDEARIKVEKNGPFHVSNIPLEDATAHRAVGASEKKYVLCRCGQSANKPFCDGSHLDAGWNEQ